MNWKTIPRTSDDSSRRTICSAAVDPLTESWSPGNAPPVNNSRFLRWRWNTTPSEDWTMKSAPGTLGLTRLKKVSRHLLNFLSHNAMSARPVGNIELTLFKFMGHCTAIAGAVP